MHPPAGRDPEAALSDFIAAYVDRRLPAPLFLVTHAAAALRAGTDLLRLPTIRTDLRDTAEGRRIRSGIVRSGVNYRLLLGLASVLVLPPTAEEYSTGAAKQTLRRKARVAVKAGVTWERVDDPGERRRLRDLADEQERTNPRDTYRIQDPDNEDLLGYRLWLVAYDRDRRPILLSVTPFDGESAILRYFRTLVDTPAASATRYLMTEVLVGVLVSLGVRYLFDNGGPLMLPNGLRHFQRMVGYRLTRVRFTTPPPLPRAGRPTAVLGSDGELLPSADLPTTGRSGDGALLPPAALPATGRSGDGALLPASVSVSDGADPG